jgi:hypothetical protein
VKEQLKPKRDPGELRRLSRENRCRVDRPGNDRRLRPAPADVACDVTFICCRDANDERLQDDRGRTAGEDRPQQGIPERRRIEVGRPIPGIHVADPDGKCRTGCREERARFHSQGYCAKRPGRNEPARCHGAASGPRDEVVLAADPAAADPDPAIVALNVVAVAEETAGTRRAAHVFTLRRGLRSDVDVQPDLRGSRAGQRDDQAARGDNRGAQFL